MYRGPDSLSSGVPIVNIGRLQRMGNRDRTPFGLRMFESRKAKGLTQKTVAAKVGIRQNTLAELEHESNSSGHTPAFAVLYEVDAHWLATGDGEARPAQFLGAEAMRRAQQYERLNPHERERFDAVMVLARSPTVAYPIQEETEMATRKTVNEKTSPKVAKIASKLMRDPMMPAKVKTVSGSALTQAPNKKKK